MLNMPIAHTTDTGRTHALKQHLIDTAQSAGAFAEAFGFRESGEIAGLWHDLGKYSKAFQDKLKAAAGEESHLEAGTSVNHSSAGALLAIKRFEKKGRLLAYIIAGHHAGLPDWETDRTGRSALSNRLKDKALLDSALSREIPPEILDRKFPGEKPVGFDPAFWLRMLFSCVVDADFLDTEEFFEPEKKALRGGYPVPADLLPLFESYMEEKQSTAKETFVNGRRRAVLARCIQKAGEPQGIFSLTVPTGGGKTLSSMAFALHHAVKNGLRRIIYVIPYTSIIEQTANEFRKIFGNAVVEHHSNFEAPDDESETTRSRLACENWDAPLIVTTSVQFFESLFAARTSRCRKLHNIAGSVVVLDEAQLLPPEFLMPILKALDELQRNYGVTVLLSTATQPAFGSQRSHGLHFTGLDHVHEIMENPAALFSELKRVEITLPSDNFESVTWESLAAELMRLPSVLCIVNRRDDCRRLWSLMPADTFHLSALMCGAHRSRRIAEIKDRLKAGHPTRVVSTQLVEAGVDLDFPVVYRAIAGLDSIAQAAGRCNREGLLKKGTLVVFSPPSLPPAGILRQAAAIGSRLLSEPCEDPLAPDRFAAFFREFYWLLGPERMDVRRILLDLAPDNDLRFSFRTAADNFKLIDDALQAPVIVSYEEGAELVGQLTRRGPERWLMRKLQRYVINLPKYLHTRLVADGAIREIHPGIFIQNHGALYDDNLGFCPDKSMIYDPDELIA